MALKPRDDEAVGSLRLKLKGRKTYLLTGGLNETTRRSIEFARAHAGSESVEAVCVELDASHTPQLKADWAREFGDTVRLHVLASPYRSISQPVIDLVRKDNAEGRSVTLIIGELVMPGLVALALHNRSTDQLTDALSEARLDVAVMYVPYHL